MQKLKEIREKYPQYKDISDMDLADKFHDKYYSDMPKEDFYKKIGASAGLFGRLKTDVQDRFENMGENAAISNSELPFQQAGEVAGLFGDVIGEGVTSAVKSAHGIAEAAAPETVKQLDEGAKKTLRALAKTPEGQAGLSAIIQGVDAWKDFSQKNPRVAKDIGAIFNIATVGLPVKKGEKAVEDFVKTPGILSEAGESLIQSGENLAKEKKSGFLKKLVSPEETKKEKLSQVDRTTEKGFLRTKDVAPSSLENRVADEVSKVPGISEKNSLQGNYNAIESERIAEAERLKATLEKMNLVIPVELDQRAKNNLLTRLEANPDFVGDARSSGEIILTEANKILEKHPKTPAGLLEARKEIDNWAKSYRSNIFDAKSENGKSIALREIRREINDVIAESAPHANVKASLRKQHLLYEALENIAPKAAKEKSNIISQTFDKLYDVLPGKRDEIKGAGAVLGAAGLGAGAIFSGPATAALTGAAATGYAGYRAYNSPAVRKAAGETLKLVDQALQTAKNPEIIKQLRVGREALVQTIKDTAEATGDFAEENYQKDPFQTPAQNALNPTPEGLK